MKRQCEICGLEAEEYWMFSYNAGKRKMWLCWDCYKQSQYEAAKSEINRQQKRYMIAKEKNRIK